MTPAGVAKTGVWNRYNALSFADRPTAYLYDAPLTADGAAAIRPPFAAITGKAVSTEWMAGLDRIETTDVTVSLYHTGQEELQELAEKVMYDEEEASQRAGLDDATAFPGLPTGYTLNVCHRLNPGLTIQEQDRGSEAQLIYRADLNYRVELFFDASA